MEVDARAQLELANVPVEFETKTTDPIGINRVPWAASVTIAVQLARVLLTTALGKQAIATDVTRVFTTTVVLAELVAWIESPPYVTETDRIPADSGLNVTEQEPPRREQDPLGLKERVPEGVDRAPRAASTTVPEQVRATPTVVEAGQLIVIAVDLRVTVIAMFPELVAWVESPL